MRSNLYTGTGDSGTTSLVGGQRVSKCCSRLEAYGSLDEFSAFLGVILSSSQCPVEMKEHLLDVQNRLFDVGCYLATAIVPETQPCCQGLDIDCIRRIEEWIDALDSQTPKIRAFVLPGGSELAAHCHVARTVCRRAERRILALAADEYVDPNVIRWMNRLSDWLFIAARFLNHSTGVKEIVWTPNSKSNI